MNKNEQGLTGPYREEVLLTIDEHMNLLDYYSCGDKDCYLCKWRKALDAEEEKKRALYKEINQTLPKTK